MWKRTGPTVTTEMFQTGMEELDMAVWIISIYFVLLSRTVTTAGPDKSDTDKTGLSPPFLLFRFFFLPSPP